MVAQGRHGVKLPVEQPSRTVEKLGNQFAREVSVGGEVRWRGGGGGRQMAKPALLTPACVEQLKVLGLCFCPRPSPHPIPPFPKVQIANTTRGQISARETGVEQLFTSGPPPASAGAPADEWFTWTAAARHPPTRLTPPPHQK